MAIGQNLGFTRWCQKVDDWIGKFCPFVKMPAGGIARSTSGKYNNPNKFNHL